MSTLEIIIVGVGLAMDAFAVSVVKGLQMKRIQVRQLFILALAFGGFQALMPVLGWLLGNIFAQRLAKVDHWIAFVLLFVIGANMIREAVTEDQEEKEDQKGLQLALTEVLFLAVATSIDALAVGVTFSFLSVNIMNAVTLIGITTFLISAAGVILGFFTGAFLKGKAEVFGGVILILLGSRILITHLLNAN